jgi:hypothetical protein
MSRGMRTSVRKRDDCQVSLSFRWKRSVTVPVNLGAIVYGLYEMFRRGSSSDSSSGL